MNDREGAAWVVSREVRRPWHPGRTPNSRCGCPWLAAPPVCWTSWGRGRVVGARRDPAECDPSATVLRGGGGRAGTAPDADRPHRSVSAGGAARGVGSRVAHPTAAAALGGRRQGLTALSGVVR